MTEYNRELLAYARALRKSMTPEERRLWYCFLHTYKPRFTRQKVLGNYIATFYCSKARLAVEVVGTGHFAGARRDDGIYRGEVMDKYGIRVLRFTNSDVWRYFDSICAEIDRSVRHG